jgi:hypothetical protein
MEAIERNTIFLVKNYYSPEIIRSFFCFLTAFRESISPSWHPCLDGCPDYHRINDEYPKSYIKAKMHSYYFHRWNSSRSIFDPFKEVFEMKNFVGGAPKNSYYDSVPSEGVISRVLSHQYPRGGGYMNEHIDPINPFSKIQTIIAASIYGKDYKKGGLFVRESPDGEIILLDSQVELGDMLVLSPSIRHGVAPVDPDDKFDWEKTDGRWMITPVIIRSDYNQDPTTKPKEA